MNATCFLRAEHDSIFEHPHLLSNGARCHTTRRYQRCAQTQDTAKQDLSSASRSSAEDACLVSEHTCARRRVKVAELPQTCAGESMRESLEQSMACRQSCSPSAS